MDITVLGTLFQEGGWGLVLFTVVIYGGWKLYQKLSARFTELSNKVDELKEDITALKVDNAKWTTAIQQCSHTDCPTKKLLVKEE